MRGLRYWIFRSSMDEKYMTASDMLSLAESSARGISIDWPSERISIYDSYSQSKVSEPIGIFQAGKRIK